MIVPTNPIQAPVLQQEPQGIKELQPFFMVSGQNDRMAGSVPVYTSFSAMMAKSADKEDESFGFSDIIDMVNPLQHIPVVSNLYQSITGDTIGALAQIVGGGIFGGPIGIVASAGMVAYQAAQKDNSTSNPAMTDVIANATRGMDTGRYNA